MEIKTKKRLKKIYSILENCRDEMEEIRDEIQEAYDDLSDEEQDEDKGENMMEEIGNIENGISDIDDMLGMMDEYTLDVEYEKEEDENPDIKEEVFFPMNIASLQVSNEKAIKGKTIGTTYAEKAKQLKQNVQIVTSTFDMFKMKVLGVSCKAYDDNTGKLQIYVEIVGNESLKEEVCVKINLYDEDDDVIDMDHSILSKKFCGLQTVCLTIMDDTILDKAVKGKVYAVIW